MTMRVVQPETESDGAPPSQSHHELQDFVENATVALHWVAADGRIVWANRAELELLGYEKDEYVGRHIAEFHVERAVIDDILSRLSANEELHDYEARLRAKDGSIRHVLINSNVYREDGKFVHTRCFTRDVSDRKRIEEALRDNERKLRTVTDALPVLVSYVDREQRYRFVNFAYEQWFGISRHEILGKSLIEVLGEQAYERIRGDVEAALAGERATFRVRLPYRLGGERDVEASYVPDLDADGRAAGFVALVADVTERRKLEEIHAAFANRTQRLLRITAAIADAVSVSEVHAALVDQVSAALDASSAGLFLVKDDGLMVSLVRGVGYPAEAERMLAAVPLQTEKSFPALDAIRRAEPIWISSQAELLERYPHLKPVVSPDRNYRIACLPIVVQGRTLGALGLTFDAEPVLHDVETFLMLVARYSGQALERLRLFGAEQLSRERAEVAAARTHALGGASQAFAEAGTDLPKLLQSIVENATAEQADGAGMMLVAESGDVLEPVAIHHRDPDAMALLRATLLSTPLRIGQGLSGRVVATGESLLVPEVDLERLLASAEPAHRASVERLRLSSLVIVPMRAHGKVIGTLSLMGQQHRPPFTEDDVEFAEELAARAALAIENSRLYEENALGRLRAELLYGFARVVVGAERIEQVFEAALDTIERALGTTRASILTYDTEGVMRFTAWRGLSDEYRNAVEGHSPWSRDAREPQPLLVSDVRSDPAMSAYLAVFEREDIVGLGFIPIVSAGRLLGKFMIYYPQPRELSSHELGMARAIADHLGSVVVRFAAVAELTESVRFYEMFTGILGHDLRNPLGAIMTAAQVAIMRADGEKLFKPLSRILTSSERMARMIDQLLDFTRARVGAGIPIQPRPLELVPMLREVVDEIDVANPGWKLRLEHTGDSNGVWDSDRLAQVFSNLVANAVQHGDSEHGVDIALDASAADRVRIEVKNRGAIPAALFPRMFQPLLGGAPRPNRSSGLGLGLFISREIVKAHGGSIDVRSADGETTFTVHLPRSTPVS